jgi:hypothetical protein
MCFPDEATKQEFINVIQGEITNVLTERAGAIAKGGMFGLGVGLVCQALVNSPL